MPARIARPLTCLAVRLRCAAAGAAALVGACSDPRFDERTARTGEALAFAPSTDTWTIIEAGDFNGDGFQDALWNNPDRSESAVWLLRGTELLEAGPPIPSPGPAAEWAAITAADYNADGFFDVPWYHLPTNQLSIQLMRGTHVLETGPRLAGPEGGFVAVQGGDFNDDGMADVLWFDPGRSLLSVWLMRGTALLEAGPALPAPPGLGWTVVNVEDFNGDGTCDILFWDTLGRHVSVWLMRGASLLEAGPALPAPPGVSWVPITTADFNGDGFADILWNDPTTNQFSVWLMRGTLLLEAGPPLSGPPGTGWLAATAGDSNADGMADVMWQNLVTHGMVVTLMRGTQVLKMGEEMPGPT